MVEGILGFIDCLSREYEELDARRLSLQSNEVCLGELRPSLTSGMLKTSKMLVITAMPQMSTMLLMHALCCRAYQVGRCGWPSAEGSHYHNRHAGMLRLNLRAESTKAVHNTDTSADPDFKQLNSIT